jgi:hypothetical protein
MIIRDAEPANALRRLVVSAVIPRLCTSAVLSRGNDHPWVRRCATTPSCFVQGRRHRRVGRPSCGRSRLRLRGSTKQGFDRRLSNYGETRGSVWTRQRTLGADVFRTAGRGFEAIRITARNTPRLREKTAEVETVSNRDDGWLSSRSMVLERHHRPRRLISLRMISSMTAPIVALMMA